jgi:hypothetical protein
MLRVHPQKDPTPMTYETSESLNVNSGPLPEPFITKSTVAERMQKCTRTIDNLMERGLPHYKVGRSAIFRWSEIEAYLAANCRVSRRGSY